MSAIDYEAEGNWKAWTDENSGYPCLILRNPHLGNLCGYVGLPDTHPCFNAHYDDVSVSVHGGLTFSGVPGMLGEDYEQADDRLWWFGFDCAHAGDAVPKFPLYRPTDVYRNMAYVERECTSLAKQLKELA